MANNVNKKLSCDLSCDLDIANGVACDHEFIVCVNFERSDTLQLSVFLVQLVTIVVPDIELPHKPTAIDVPHLNPAASSTRY